MDEDSERILATSSKFAETIIQAYKLRFPEPTKDSHTITINSLLIALLSYISTMHKEERIRASESCMNAFMEMLEYE